MANQEVLALPRSLFEGLDRFLPWETVATEDMDEQQSWVPRDRAERSTDLVQPIPCAVLRNPAAEICVFRRIRDTRADLRTRITLLVGGHVDRIDSANSVSDLLLTTLWRELKEEVGLSKVAGVTPLGLVVDALSIEASRHVGFVYEVTTEQRLRTLANEEFSKRSKFSGRFFPPQKLKQFHHVLDPWSLLLFEDFLFPGSADQIWRQSALSFPSEG